MNDGFDSFRGKRLGDLWRGERRRDEGDGFGAIASITVLFQALDGGCGATTAIVGRGFVILLLMMGAMAPGLVAEQPATSYGGIDRRGGICGILLGAKNSTIIRKV